MSRYLLDTNACIALMKENAGVVPVSVRWEWSR